MPGPHFHDLRNTGNRFAARSGAELEDLIRELSDRVPGLDEWYHVDAHGTLWMCVSFDFITDNAVAATLRLDGDGHGKLVQRERSRLRRCE